MELVAPMIPPRGVNTLPPDDAHSYY